ncbi:MAG TPA: XdhC family protein [Gemmatimonadota bacterium]|nr:XdhC family protein [Gemmatimonadota bacterium]
MSIEEIRPRVESWRAAGERYGVAVLTGAWRSAPRKPGARFVRSESGEIAGNVSAGCVEADLAERLAGVLAGEEPSTVTYDVSDETAHGVGLACGGRIDVFLEARSPDDPVWPALLDRLDARATVFLITDTSPAAAAHWLVAPDGEVLAADTDRPPPPAAVEVGREMLDTGGVRLIEAGRDAGGAPPADAPVPVLVEVFLPSRRLIVVGATPVGAALARLARAAGIDVEVIEPRSAYADALRDTDVEVDERWPEEALPPRAPDRSTAVAVVAHDVRLDVAALEAALRSPAGYVGLLGGGRTRRARFEALREVGVAEDRISAVHAPIGLDIGAEKPAEIALAILAQIVTVWRGAA